MLQSAGIRTISATELDDIVPELAELLRDTVNTGGPSLGFLPPVSAAAGCAYWRSLRPELQSGSRLLLVAFARGRVIGSGQLELPHWPNAPHRAELQKLLVAAALRGRGIGKLLIGALHDAARRLGRSLLILNARHGGPAERLYKRLGYREAGVVPGFTVGPAGERYDCITLYQEL
jgi:acetyltransferase